MPGGGDGRGILYSEARCAEDCDCGGASEAVDCGCGWESVHSAVLRPQQQLRTHMRVKEVLVAVDSLPTARRPSFPPPLLPRRRPPRCRFFHHHILPPPLPSPPAHSPHPNSTSVMARGKNADSLLPRRRPPRCRFLHHHFLPPPLLNPSPHSPPRPPLHHTMHRG